MRYSDGMKGLKYSAIKWSALHLATNKKTSLAYRRSRRICRWFPYAAAPRYALNFQFNPAHFFSKITRSLPNLLSRSKVTNDFGYAEHLSEICQVLLSKPDAVMLDRLLDLRGQKNAVARIGEKSGIENRTSYPVAAVLDDTGAGKSGNCIVRLSVCTVGMLDSTASRGNSKLRLYCSTMLW